MSLPLFDEPTAKSLIGTKLPGTIVRVQCEDYEFKIPETGEVISLAHSYEDKPDEMTSTVKERVLQPA